MRIIGPNYSGIGVGIGDGTDTDQHRAEDGLHAQFALAHLFF